MPKPRHTKGPWTAGDKPESPFITIYAKGDEVVICDVMGEDVKPWASVEANARLISAAPCLLAACQAFVAWDENAHATEEEASALRRMIASAIAKATNAEATAHA